MELFFAFTRHCLHEVLRDPGCTDEGLERGIEGYIYLSTLSLC